jgi:hypothetical protein
VERKKEVPINKYADRDEQWSERELASAHDTAGWLQGKNLFLNGPYRISFNSMHTSPKISFRSFVLRQHRRSLLLAVLLVLPQVILYKIYYPHTIVNYDASHYVEAAAGKLGIYFWPIGYSMILRLLHAVSHSDWLVFVFQYLLLQGCLLYFYFTLLYLMRPGKWVSRLMFIFFTVNPIIIIISNYVLSDSIFMALTIWWFALTLWYIYRPRALLIYAMVVLLFLLFAIRYYAIFYPLFTAVVVLFSKLSWRAKLGGLGFGCLLFAGFIWYTSSQYKKLIGYASFSPFSGWLLAENALIMYRSLHTFSEDQPDSSLMPLHRFVTAQLQDMQKKPNMPDSPLCTYYMWWERGPLRRYMGVKYKNDSVTSQFKKFCSMGREYKAYANFLIRRHPLEFIRYYMGQNAAWFVNPAIELEDHMDNGWYYSGGVIRQWFGYRSDALAYKPNRLFTMQPYLIVMFMANLVFLAGAVGFYFCGCYKVQPPVVNRAVLLSAGFWVVNCLFVLVSAPVMMRYGFTIMFLNMAFGLVLLEYVWKVAAAPIILDKPQHIAVP